MSLAFLPYLYTCTYTKYFVPACCSPECTGAELPYVDRPLNNNCSTDHLPARTISSSLTLITTCLSGFHDNRAQISFLPAALAFFSDRIFTRHIPSQRESVCGWEEREGLKEYISTLRLLFWLLRNVSEIVWHLEEKEGTGIDYPASCRRLYLQYSPHYCVRGCGR